MDSSQSVPTANGVSDPAISQALQLLQSFPVSWDRFMDGHIREILRPYSVYSSRLEKFLAQEIIQPENPAIKRSVQTAQIGLTLISRADRTKVIDQLMTMASEIVAFLKIHQAHGLSLSVQGIQSFISTFVFDGPHATLEIRRDLEQSLLHKAS